jgi:hypothetical protein
VLYGDMSVDFVQNPLVGVARDNIFTFGRREDTAAGYGVVGSPTRADDSVLLPALSPELWQRGRTAQRNSLAAWIAVPLLLIAIILWRRRASALAKRRLRQSGH